MPSGAEYGRRARRQRGAPGDVRAEEGRQTDGGKVCAALLSGVPSKRFRPPTPS